MSSQLTQLQDAAIKQYCKTLRMPMMAPQFSTLAEQAVRENKTHTRYLKALLTAEVEERERNTIDRRVKDAHLPWVKTLEEFDYTQAPMVTAAKMYELAEGGYIERAEPILLIGDCGTGKTPAYALPRAGRSGASVSRPPQHSLTSWWKRNINSNCGV
ncbi:MAG TPA: ATP-binding protein [Bryobacteraceae bacterium]|nr:ATP-binding protein [Bryobacteraceae bacterium]